jgi:hypothetical protein
MASGFDGVPDLIADSGDESDKELTSPNMAARLKKHAANKKAQKKVQQQAAGALQERGRTFPHAVRAAQSGASAEDACRRHIESALTKLLCVLYVKRYPMYITRRA